MIITFNKTITIKTTHNLTQFSFYDTISKMRIYIFVLLFITIKSKKKGVRKTKYSLVRCFSENVAHTANVWHGDALI